ncbi:MAG: cytochrome c biogenesis protein ResB [Nocardioides sp.]
MSFTEERASERQPGELSLRELLRWGWRQLTSMRTALMLLLLLALAAVPGSLIPQAGVDSIKSGNFRDDHPRLAPVFERLGLFSVYTSPWFSAVYLLLMVSLVGCILPRTAVYWRALRAAPPPAPRRFTRLPAHTTYTTAAAESVVLARAEQVLRRRRFRVATGPGGASRAALARAALARAAAGQPGALGWPVSAATSARRATCSSTWPSWWCWSASPSAAWSATRAA